jgi:phosphoglucosamine mutase
MSKARKYFGTDGIRGKVGESPINAEFVLKLGWAVGRVLAAQQGGNKVLIGKDTRISGYMFESALEAGLSAAGVNIHLLGPMPTPAIAYLTRTLRAQAGIVISASHNLYEDNGIKFFSDQGLKLPDHLEEAIEEQIAQPMVTVDSAKLGKAVRVVDAPGRYIEFCKSTVPSTTSLHGMRLVLDCANGATYYVAPHVYRELGATVIELGTKPNGLNINHGCGSTNPEQLQRRVVEEKADLGIALDGDGDRVMMVDHSGTCVDGDELLFIIAQDRQNRGVHHGGVVGTQMSNLGLELALKQLGIAFARAPVGDRHVLAELVAQKWSLGGESSGHIICLDATTTGDGIISSLQVMRAIHSTGKSLYDLKRGMTKYPQSLVNIKAVNGTAVAPEKFLQQTRLTEAIEQARQALAGKGRIVLRPSGTEPVIRVMVEGEDAVVVDRIAKELAAVVTEAMDTSF